MSQSMENTPGRGPEERHDVRVPGLHPATPDVTTTHGPWGSGRPRLAVSGDGAYQEIPIEHDVFWIGSDAKCDIRYDGVDPVHAEIVHEETDEYVVTMRGPGRMSVDPESMGQSGVPRSMILRQGATFAVGPLRFVFMRDEFADHGRPFGGRQGGEGAQQQRQGPRPDYAGHPVDDGGHTETGAIPVPPPSTWQEAPRE